MTPYSHARRLIDQAHAGDPDSTGDRPAELVYADRIEEWVSKLVPDAPEILLLAARCQHLERWKTPRDTFPAGREGYLKWRSSLYQIQARRASELLVEASVSLSEAEQAYRWVSKTGLRSDASTQALEDAAVLVFLEHELADFAASHPEYPAEKFIGILRKSLLKTSPAARLSASRLHLPPQLAPLFQAAYESL